MARLLAVAAFVLLVIASCGGGRNADQLLPADSASPSIQLPEFSAGLPAFPDEQLAAERSVSDDTVTLQGRDWSEKSDNAEEIGSTLEINGPDNAWGIYALAGFGQVLPGNAFCSFWTEDATACQVWLAVADFNLDRWVFSQSGRDDYGFEFPEGGNYVSPTGNCYVLVLRTGEGKSKVYSLTIGRRGATDLEAPAGLAANAEPGLVNLSWLGVAGAAGYNLYRAYDPKFTNPIKLNEDLLTEAAYADDWLISGEMYFYRVTAVAAIESAYSNTASVFVPAADLPAPQNLRLLDAGDDFIEFAWDWSQANPQGWSVFLANGRDFNLEAPTEEKIIAQGGARSYKYAGLNPGRLYYIRMAARQSGALGRMTEALPCLTGDQWEWFDVEEIGDGTEPVSAVIADGKICCSYLNDNVVHVAINGGEAQPWTVESTALDHSIEYYNSYIGEWISAGGFTGVLDIDYSNGTYLIASVTRHHNDYWAAIGAPGVGWTVELIDEGTASGQFDAPSAGLYGSVAISDNGYVASGLDFYLGQYCTYSRAFGSAKPWNKQTIRAVPFGLPIEFDLEVLDGDLYASCFDFTDRQLYLWSELDGFTRVTDNPEGVTLGIYTDLERMADHWVAPGYHGGEQNIYFLEEGSGEYWDTNVIRDQDDYPAGRNVRMEPFRDSVVCVYMGGSTRDWYCSVLRSGGVWETQLMKIGEIDAYERCDLKILDDRPVFMVADRITKKVYAVRGNIPQE
ncbi:hypothetical protein KDL44_02945 [bacterium]|nr:hypothetical protein [bacterium]